MIVYDSNIFYRAIKDCRTAPNKSLCETQKRTSLELLKLGKKEGCIIPPTVAKEVRKDWILEYADECKVVSTQDIYEDRRKREFVKKFIDKLTVIASKDKTFLRTCTHEDPDKWRAILKSRNGDWKIVAESILLSGEIGKEVKIASFDRDITSNYCIATYKRVAEDIAKKLKIKIGNIDVIRPDIVRVEL